MDDWTPTRQTLAALDDQERREWAELLHAQIQATDRVIARLRELTRRQEVYCGRLRDERAEIAAFDASTSQLPPGEDPLTIC